MEQSIHIHIPDDGEYNVSCAFGSEVPAAERTEATTREIVLSRGLGDEIEHGDDPMTFKMWEDQQIIVIPHEGRAIGYFLHALETHGATEATKEQLHEDGILHPWEDWQSQLTKRDRRNQLLDLLEWRSDFDEVAAQYIGAGATWRSTDLQATTDAKTTLGSLEDHSPRTCYLTAQLAAMKHIDNHRVSYVEGIALPETAGQCIKHAWIEIDGEVAELTWPWHRWDGGEAVYFGVEFPKEEVEDARNRRDVHGAIIDGLE